MKKIFESLKSLKNLHIITLILVDAAVIIIDTLTSFLFFSHFGIMPFISWRTTAVFSALVLFSIVGIALFNSYKIILKFASASSLLRIIAGVGVGFAVAEIVNVALKAALPASYFILLFFIVTFTVCLARMVCNYVVNKVKLSRIPRHNEPVLIIGAGYTGSHLLQEILHSDATDYSPIGFVDDNPQLHGHIVGGVPILGPTILIPEFCKTYKVKTILFAIPSCEEKRKEKILSICAQTNCEIKVVPSLWDLASKVHFLHQARTINVEDVLGRDVVNLGSSNFAEYSKGKTVMVTGVGSIGSEICRQVVKCDVKKLIMVDIYENNAYDIQQELVSDGYKDKIATEIASVRDYDKMEHLFTEYKPDIVFHAAAHKHVPLMEQSPEEAIKNNVLGTFNVASLSLKHKIDKMVLISTDKAVNPTNVMGASKRCCEMIMQYMAQKETETDFVAVRFGNVLGSNGSVIPLFVKQIERGGPVTVTHPDIIRYFMTIPEAVSLVLEAGAMAEGGEIFVLDMGEPFKITTLAENLIRLYGYEPYTEMPIEFIGLRPGEKLFEELLMAEEGLKSTENNSIFIGNQIAIESEKFEKDLAEIIDISKGNNCDDVVNALKRIVPTFQKK